MLAKTDGPLPVAIVVSQKSESKNKSSIDQGYCTGSPMTSPESGPHEQECSCRQMIQNFVRFWVEDLGDLLCPLEKSIKHLTRSLTAQRCHTGF